MFELGLLMFSVVQIIRTLAVMDDNTGSDDDTNKNKMRYNDLNLNVDSGND